MGEASRHAQVWRADAMSHRRLFIQMSPGRAQNHAAACAARVPGPAERTGTID